MTRVGLKPVCNVICVIFGRSKAKDRDCVNYVTLRLQTFGTRLCYKNFMLIMNIFLAKKVGTIFLFQLLFHITVSVSYFV